MKGGWERGEWEGGRVGERGVGGRRTVTKLQMYISTREISSHDNHTLYLYLLTTPLWAQGGNVGRHPLQPSCNSLCLIWTSSAGY